MISTIKIKCPICKKTVEKTSDYIQKCSLCNFYFDASSREELEKSELLEITKKELKELAIAFEARHKEVVWEASKSERLVFCFTGKLNTITRNEAIVLLDNNGHYFSSGISYSVDYLVTNNRTTGSVKLKKAREINVSIIDENQFLAIMGK